MRSITLSLLIFFVLISGCRTEREDIVLGDADELIVGQREVQDSSTRGVDPGNRTIVLSGFNGDIELRGSNDPTARLEFIRRARGATDERAQEVLQSVEVDESGTDDSYRFAMTTSDPARSAVDVRGTVPVGSSLNIELQSGHISIVNVDGPIDITNENGGIEVSGASQRMNLNTRNGDIAFDMRMIPPEGNVVAETRNGSIEAGLPTSASLRVDARTSVGDIYVSGLAFENRRLDRRQAGARFSAQLGGGTTDVNVNTENGSIRLRESGGMAAPLPDTTFAPVDTLEIDESAAGDTLLPTVDPDTSGIDRDNEMEADL